MRRDRLTKTTEQTTYALMKIFSATVLVNVAAFEMAVERVYPGSFLKIADNAWLIAAAGTAQEICAALGMPDKPGQASPFSAVVVGVNGYYGYGSSHIWEWMYSKQAADA